MKDKSYRAGFQILPLKFVSEEECRVTHDIYESFLIPRSSIVGTLLAIVEIFERREPSYLVLFADRVKFGAVESSQNCLFVVFEVFSSILVLWLCCLTVPTPWSIEHHQYVTLLLEKWLEVFVSEVIDLRGVGGERERERERERESDRERERERIIMFIAHNTVIVHILMAHFGSKFVMFCLALCWWNWLFRQINICFKDVHNHIYKLVNGISD